MKKICPFLVIIFFAIYIQAQTIDTNVSEKAVENTDSTNKSKFNLPPEKAKPVSVAKFSASPVIDGKLDDEVWKSAQVLKDFVQTSPGDNIAASKPTEVMLGYDEKNLYIAFRCFDDKDKIRATVAKRDDIFGEDNVRVLLDTYDDQRLHFEF